MKVNVWGSRSWLVPLYDACLYMSLITRKPVFGVCDHDSLKPACSAIETSYGLEILVIASWCIVLSRQRTTKALIRQRGCAGWSAPLLLAYGINRFSHDAAHIIALTLQTETPVCISFEIKWFSVSFHRHQSASKNSTGWGGTRNRRERLLFCVSRNVWGGHYCQQVYRTWRLWEKSVWYECRRSPRSGQQWKNMCAKYWSRGNVLLIKW